MKITKDRIIFLIIVSIFVVVLSSISTYATSYLFNSNEVSYDNNTSGIQADNVQGAIDTLYEEATNYTEMRNLIYPVGSIYISVTDDTVEKVEARYGGTWEVFGAGRTIIGVGTGTDSNSTNKTFTINETSGEYTHTLTGNESGIQAHSTTSSGAITNGITGGSHSHQIPIRHGDGTKTTGEVLNCGLVANVSDGRIRGNTASSTHTHNLPNHTHTISAANAKNAHNIIQPYITAYMYKRIS